MLFKKKLDKEEMVERDYIADIIEEIKERKNKQKWKRF